MPQDEQPDKFKFTFRIRDVETEELKNAPDGWLTTKITYKTDTFYKALRRSLTLPLKFVFKGAYLCRREVYTYGLFAWINLSIGRLRPSDWGYDTIYNGRLDFSKGEDSQSRYTTDAISADFTIQLDAYDTTKFAIPLTGDDVIDVTLPALTLQEQADFIFESNNGSAALINAYLPVSIVNNQQVASQSSVQNVKYLNFNTPTFDKDNPNYFFIARAAGSVRIKINLIGGIIPVGGIKHYQISIYKSDNTQIKVLLDSTNPDPFAFDINADFLTPVEVDDRLFIYLDDVGGITGEFVVSVGQMSLTYNTSTQATKCKGIRAYSLFTRLLQKMNVVSPNEPAQPVPNQSYMLDPVFNGEFKNLVYTCSDSIRAFYVGANGQATASTVGALYNPGDTLQANGRYLVINADIIYNDITLNPGDEFNWVLGKDSFTSPDGTGFVKQVRSTPSILMPFKDFFQDMRALKGGQVGLSVQKGVVIMEDLGFFYQSGAGTLNVGTVDVTTKVVPATDMMYNSIKGGFKDQQYDLVNGLNEVHSEVIYATDRLVPASQLDLQAISRADPIGIEITRVTPVDTSSSRSDNNNFMIIIEDEPLEDGSFKPVQMDVLTSFSGVDVSYYNWSISPKQNLLRGGRYLRSIFDKMDGYKIRVTAPAKSVAMITIDDTGRRVYEGQDETISAAFGDQLFLPWYFNITPGLPINALDLIDNNPNTDIALTWNNVQSKGFPVEVNIDEGENSPQNFKLLASPSNNMLNLIR